MATELPELTGFDMVEMIGRGGMAVVWKARQTATNRTVAIKFIPDSPTRHPNDIRNLRAEASAASKLKHPGIVQIYETNEENGLFYVVMEYIAGYSVGKWLRRKNTLSEEDALLIAEHVGHALSFGWRTEKIVHCDVKPDNIMVDSDGTVKVADLGLARIAGVVSSDADNEHVLGTPSYMSPEQARGEPHLDCRTDIYSLGATLYHLVTGKRLFQAETDTVIIEKQNEGRVPSPMDLNPKVSIAMCLLLEKMLIKDRDLRYPGWEAVLSDIRRVGQGRLPAEPLPPEGASTVIRSPDVPAYLRAHQAERSAPADGEMEIRPPSGRLFVFGSHRRVSLVIWAGVVVIMAIIIALIAW